MIKMVEAGVQSGAVAHTMERSLFEYVLQLGHVLLGLYLVLQGNDDLGATIPTADAREVRRLDGLRTRCYLSVFGEHEPSFVETTCFQGTCYKAANWVYLGQTQGRGNPGLAGK